MADKENMEARVSALKADIRAYATEVEAQVQALHTSVSDTLKIDLKNDPRNCIRSLRLDLTEALDLARGAAPDKDQPPSSSSSSQQHVAELEECDHLAQVLSDVVATCDALNDVEGQLGSSNVLETCRRMAELDVLVARLPTSSSLVGAGPVCRLLRKEALAVKGRLRARLLRLIDSAIQVETGHVRVLKIIQTPVSDERVGAEGGPGNSSVTLSDVWAALVSVNEHVRAVRKVLDDVVRLVFRPLWRERKGGTTPLHSASFERAELMFETLAREVESAGGVLEGRGSQRSPGPDGVTPWMPMGTGTSIGNNDAAGAAGGFAGLSGCRLPLPTLLDHVSLVLSFVWTQVLGEDDQLAQSAVEVLEGGGTGLNAALCNTLREMLPKAEKDFPNFERGLLRVCTDFDVNLSSLGAFGEGLIDKTKNKKCGTGSADRLPDMVQQLPAVYMEGRRRAILAEARTLVLSHYHNTMLVSGDAQSDDPASAGGVGDGRVRLDQSVRAYSADSLGFEVCQVSLTSCRLLKLVYAVLDEAIAAKIPELPYALYQTARDCLELFLTLVPFRYADVIHTNPRMGAIFYNDCVYMAHNTTLLTHHMTKTHLAKRVDGGADAGVDLGDADKDKATFMACVGFVDFIPRFKAVGERCLGSHVDLQQSTVQSLLSDVRLSPTGEAEASRDSGNSWGAQNTPATTGAADAGAATSIACAQEDGGIDTITGGNRDGGGMRMGRGGLVGSLVEQLGLAPRAAQEWVPPRQGAGAGGGSANDEVAALALTQHMTSLRGIWHGVLQESVYERLVGHLVGHVLQSAMQVVMTAPMISESACNDIVRVFQALQGCRGIFADESPEMIARLVGPWTKFLALTELLGFSMNDIAEWLPRRKFADFTCNELRSLVQALFDESPRQQALLGAIADMGARSG